MSSRISRTSAIILRSYNFSEADKIIVLFSKELGKVRAVAKGVRKCKSRLAGSLGLLNHADVQLYGREQSELFRITQAQLVTSYSRIKIDLDRLALAARMVELVEGFTPDRLPLPDVFDLLEKALSMLDFGTLIVNTLMWFEIKLLDTLGYCPNLKHCLICQQETPKMTFDPEGGGVVCSHCRPGGQLWVSKGSRRLLEHLLAMSRDKIDRLQIQSRLQKEIIQLLNATIQLQLGHPLKSDVFRNAIDGLEK